MCILKEFVQAVKYLKETPKYRLLVKQKHGNLFSFSSKLLVYRVLCIRDTGPEDISQVYVVGTEGEGRMVA